MTVTFFDASPAGLSPERRPESIGATFIDHDNSWN